MLHNALSVLNNPEVRAALKEAWERSQPGPVGGHEEGGFVLRDSVGNLNIERWPPGQQNATVVPPHSNCRVGNQDIVATFHTHPNTAGDYLQEPGETDKRAVRDDPHLKGKEYVGEFVISAQIIYWITPDGYLDEIARTQEYMAKDQEGRGDCEIDD
jgi:hypothetical protein